MRIAVSAKILMEILPQLDRAASDLNRVDHVLRLGILRAQLFHLARELNRIQFESGGLGPCLGARHTHMAAFPEGGFVKTGVTR
jgi:hypothetical protein